MHQTFNMNPEPSCDSYSWGTMDGQQLPQTKGLRGRSIFGATLLATVVIAMLLYDRMDTGQLVLFAAVVLGIVGFIESQLTSDQFKIHGICADATGIDVLVRYIYENERMATIERIHLDWSDIDTISAAKISEAYGEALFGPRITLASPLKLAKPVRVVSDFSFIDSQFPTRPLSHQLVSQLLRFRDQAFHQMLADPG
jgi:hypothetical protein